jgi:hypothetical protein
MMKKMEMTMERRRKILLKRRKRREVIKDY